MSLDLMSEISVEVLPDPALPNIPSANPEVPGKGCHTLGDNLISTKTLGKVSSSLFTFSNIILIYLNICNQTVRWYARV